MEQTQSKGYHAMIVAKTATNADRRQSERYKFVRYVFFATNKQFFQGELRDFSRHGLYIQSTARLAVGEIITVALPYSKYKNEKRKGEIVWKNKKGFGVELFRDPKKRIWREDLL